LCKKKCPLKKDIEPCYKRLLANFGCSATAALNDFFKYKKSLLMHSKGNQQMNKKIINIFLPLLICICMNCFAVRNDISSADREYLENLYAATFKYIDYIK